jgi:hypothetical protein
MIKAGTHPYSNKKNQQKRVSLKWLKMEDHGGTSMRLSLSILLSRSSDLFILLPRNHNVLVAVDAQLRN